MLIKRSLKIISVVTAFLLAAGTYSISADVTEDPVGNKSIQELETLKVKNNLKLEELQRGIEKSRKEFESTSKTEKSKKEYRDKLNEKIKVQNQNLEYLVRQINQLESEVQDTSDGIEEIESEIAANRQEADETLTMYKVRLRAEYMSGEDTLSAVITGSTSFFDILTKAEIASRLARRDNDTLTALEKKLKQLSEMDDQLTFKYEILSTNLDEASLKKEELDEKLSLLSSDFAEIQSELEKLSNEKINFKKDYDSQKAAVEQQMKEQEKITAAIKAEQERLSEEMEKIEEQARKQGTLSVKPSGSGIKQYIQASAGDMLWPVPGYTSHSSFYGYREFDNSDHKAIDIQGNPDDTIEFAKIYAAESGTVITAQNYCTHYQGKSYSCGCGGGYGNYIVLQHSDGVYQTVYAHCYTIYVSEGETVRKGQLIGLVGSTGYSTGPHLHFEVRKNGEKTNPDSYTYQNYG